MPQHMLQQAQQSLERAQQLDLNPPPPQVGPPQTGPPAGPSPGLQPGMAAGTVPPPAMPQEALPPEPPPVMPGDTPRPGTVVDAGTPPSGHPASATEQREYVKAMEALYQVLYSDSKTSRAIVQGLESTPDNKVEPIAKMGITLIAQLDEQIDLDEAVVAEVTAETVERLIEMAEVRYKADYSDLEMQRALGATWEGVMLMFGVDEDNFSKFAEGLSQKDILRSKQVYAGALGEEPAAPPPGAAAAPVPTAAPAGPVGPMPGSATPTPAPAGPAGPPMPPGGVV